MIETSHPMHAFDYDKLDGGKLILRASKNHEKFQTIQQGTELILTPDDLAICDSSSVQGLSTIGGLKTKVTSSTHQIILETAVYSPAQSRRTARRHKTFTESSLRHEKHQDPSELNFVLARAVYLLQEVASAKVVSQISDYYPRPVAPLELAFDPQDITKLTGVNVSTTDLTTKLTDLGFKTISHTPQLLLTVPPFRTDIESSADVVEEVIRLVGYDKIPQTPLSGPIPPPQTYPSYLVQEKIRDILTSLRLNEVITSTMTDNKSTNSISLLNPPDPTMPYLRTQLSQQLIPYAQKLLARNIQSLAFFEIGKVFHSHKNQYLESLHLSICLAGNISRSNWRVTHPRPYDIYDLTGLIDTFKLLTGYQDLTVEFSNTDNIFCCEINLDNLGLPKQVTQAYDTISQFPAVIEDVNVPCDTSYANLETKVRKLSPLIKSIELVDKYQNRLTLRITFHSSTHQLSKQETSVITQKISNL
jgi:phenylalanyl-tRNA synthetase beta chain